MRRQLLSLLILLSVNTITAANVQDPLTSPIGDWQTVDDDSHRVIAIIQIKEMPDHTLSGTLIKTFPLPGTTIHTCVKCDPKDPRYNKPILGMTIMTGFKQVGDTWTGGQILDPKKGTVYSCTIRVVDHGKKLNVRGYVLFSLLGRTQTWIRDTNALK